MKTIYLFIYFIGIIFISSCEKQDSMIHYHLSKDTLDIYDGMTVMISGDWVIERQHFLYPKEQWYDSIIVPFLMKDTSRIINTKLDKADWANEQGAKFWVSDTMTFQDNLWCPDHKLWYVCKVNWRKKWHFCSHATSFGDDGDVQSLIDYFNSNGIKYDTIWVK